jgi:hypothetical protein
MMCDEFAWINADFWGRRSWLSVGSVAGAAKSPAFNVMVPAGTVASRRRLVLIVVAPANSGVQIAAVLAGDEYQGRMKYVLRSLRAGA